MLFYNVLSKILSVNVSLRWSGKRIDDPSVDHHLSQDKLLNDIILDFRSFKVRFEVIWADIRINPRFWRFLAPGPVRDFLILVCSWSGSVQDLQISLCHGTDQGVWFSIKDVPSRFWISQNFWSRSYSKISQLCSVLNQTAWSFDPLTLVS